MPPVTSTATRSPRTAPGPSDGSSGLTALPALALQDLEDLADRPLRVVVHDHVVVARGEAHLHLGQPLAGCDHLRRLAGPAHAPAQQLLHRGRADEDEQPVPPALADLLGALDLDLQDHVEAPGAGGVHPGGGGAVAVAVDPGVL